MNERTKQEAMLGGVDLTVKKLDGSTETIKVRQLPVRLMARYAAAVQDEPEQIRLFTDRDMKWVESLSDDSFVAIVKEGQRMAEPFFSDWLTRQRQLAGVINQGVTGASPSPTTSPESAST